MMKSKVKNDTAQAVLRKWKQHHTIRDFPKTGRLAKVDARTRRRLARMAQSGEVSTAPELALTAASHDLVHASASTASRVLHQEGLKTMHMIRKPLLTHEHKRRRLEWARAHRDCTVEQWKQVVFSSKRCTWERAIKTKSALTFCAYRTCHEYHRACVALSEGMSKSVTHSKLEGESVVVDCPLVGQSRTTYYILVLDIV
ncbi:hypothetical protein EON65_44505 [archaeon]|nr:MAG: hypothetical protein EON65_44505 [archaeon]